MEANSSGLSDLLNAVNYARNQPGVSVVSMSWGASEFSSETSFDSYFTTPAGHTGVTFVGSSGDNGSPSLWPALSSNVLAVGGTTLNVSGSAGTYVSESGWSGSGGGLSRYELEPSYQRGVQTKGMRSGPDVSYDANPSTGFPVYDSVTTSGQSGWFEVGGTSAGAPQWSALIAIANQGRAANGLAALNGVNSQIYALPSSDFHDSTSGNNGGYAAGAGYDMVTGRGSPIAYLVIGGLMGSSTTASATPATVVQSSLIFTSHSSLTDSGSGDNGSSDFVNMTQAAQQVSEGATFATVNLATWTPANSGSVTPPMITGSWIAGTSASDLASVTGPRTGSNLLTAAPDNGLDSEAGPDTSLTLSAKATPARNQAAPRHRLACRRTSCNADGRLCRRQRRSGRSRGRDDRRDLGCHRFRAAWRRGRSIADGRRHPGGAPLRGYAVADGDGAGRIDRRLDAATGQCPRAGRATANHDSPGQTNRPPAAGTLNNFA